MTKKLITYFTVSSISAIIPLLKVHVVTHFLIFDGSFKIETLTVELKPIDFAIFDLIYRKGRIHTIINI